MNWKCPKWLIPSELTELMREQQKGRVDRSKQPHPKVKIIDIVTGKEAIAPKESSDAKK